MYEPSIHPQGASETPSLPHLEEQGRWKLRKPRKKHEKRSFFEFSYQIYVFWNFSHIHSKIIFWALSNSIYRIENFQKLQKLWEKNLCENLEKFMYFEIFYTLILKVFFELFQMQFTELRISKNSRSYD